MSGLRFTINSLNTRGIRDKKKRTKLYNWLLRHDGNSGIHFLQEAHCTPEVQVSWNAEWKGLSHFSCGTNQSKGVITLIGKDIDYKEKHVIRDKYGRFVIIYCEIQGMEFCLINLYAPNTETEQIDFYNQIFQEVTCLSCNENVNYVWGGDYNCPLSKIDVDKMHIRLKTKSINVLKQIMETYNLLDIWRVRNPSIKSYTYRSLQPLVQRRLDYFLISDNIQHMVTKAVIIPSVGTDHSAVSLTLSSLPEAKHGPSHWRLNISLLDDENYIFGIKQLINKRLQTSHSKAYYDSKTTWEYFKFQIREFSINYSKKKAKDLRDTLQNLENKVIQMEEKLKVNDLSVNFEYVLAKKELERYFDKITYGIIIRSRVQWYEQGEKNTKYFLGLEKSVKQKVVLGKL